MNFYRNSGQRAHPGEPLYTLDEIGDRLKQSPARLAVLIGKYPGFTAWARAPGNSNRSARKLYRYSDAKRWWATLPACWEADTQAVQ